MQQEKPAIGSNAIDLAARIVQAYVSANPIPAAELPALITNVHRALSNLNSSSGDFTNEKSKPAISIAKSVSDDFIVCLEDGKKLKMLKRYLRSNFGLTPEEYRKKWGLPPDYPMVAPNYAIRRSEFAKKIGLGRGVRGAH